MNNISLFVFIIETICEQVIFHRIIPMKIDHFSSFYDDYLSGSFVSRMEQAVIENK